MRTLLTRSISGLIFVALVVLSLILEPYYFLVFSAIIVGIGSSEFHRLFFTKETKGSAESIYMITSLCIYLLLSAPYYFENLTYNSVNYILLATFVFYLILQLFLYQVNIKKLLILLGGMAYVIIPFVLASEIHSFNQGEFPLLLAVFILVWTNDTFAYITGNLIGKHKLYEKISPNKTWEGFAGGVAFTIAAGYLLDLYTAPTQNEHLWMIAALVIAPAAVAGDLIESAFKRKMNVKDTGKIMPGHGGILDRFDAMLLALPVFYIFLYLCS